ncbi:MAG: F0F1 ATP synthase subunit B [Patescibacteria group bacterium]
MASTEIPTSTTAQAETSTTVEQVTEDSGVLGTFGIRGDLFIAQLINFVLVLLVLWRFVYKPMIAMLDARESKIAQAMKDADDMAKRSAESAKEREAMLVDARREAQAMIEAAMHETDIRKNEMIESAKREVERVISKGKEQLIQEREASLMALRKDVVDIAVRAAAKIVTEGVTAKKSQSLAEEVVRKMT